MAPSTHPPPSHRVATYHLRDWLLMALAAGLYAVLMKMSVSYLWFIVHGSLVWLPNGLALAVLIWGGPKYWPAIFVGALLGHFAIGNPSHLDSNRVLIGILGSSFSKTLSVILAAWLIRRIPQFDPNFTHARDFGWLAVAGAAGGIINAIGGAGSLWLAGMTQVPVSLGSTIRDFWMGDVLAVLLVVPFLLVWRHPPRIKFFARSFFEALGCLLLAWTLGQMLFADWQPVSISVEHLTYLPFAFVLWGAVRFGRHLALLLIGMFAIQTLLGSAREVGVFDQHDPMGIWMFILTLSVTGIIASLLFHDLEQATAKIKQSNQLLEASQTIAGVGGWELDLHSNKLFWTAETYRLHDTTPAEFNPTVEAGISYFLPESRIRISAALIGAVEHGKGYNLELETLTTKGRLIQVHTTCEVTMHDGRPRKLTGIFHDITKQKQAERSLRESEERYRLLFDHNPLPMWLYDESTLRFIAVNETAVKSYGYTQSEFLELKIVELHPAEEHERLSQYLANRKINQPAVNRGWHHQRKDRSIFSVDITASPLEFQGHSARLVVAEDRTEKQQLQEQFLRAQRLESLGMLAAGIAHDFNNVLAPIGMAGTLLRRNVTETGDIRLLDTLEKSTNRGAGLVRQILGFAQDLGGEHRVVSIRDLLKEIGDLARETFPKSVVLNSTTMENLWTVKASPTQIHQVLLNLCVNARDAMPEGGTLRLIAENQTLEKSAVEAILATQPGVNAKPGKWVVVQVEDSGFGIKPEILNHIWDPFFTSKSAEGGTGLGLSTVRGIIAAHQGFITLHTELNRGTTFRVYLPAQVMRAPVNLPSPSAPTMRGHGELILVVDDEEGIREIIKVILLTSGYEVVTAENGAAATEIFTARSAEISLVISDYDMPLVRGDELTRRIRKIDPKMKVLEVSGLDSSSLARPGKRPRFADAYLAKPFPVERLLEEIQLLL